MFKRILNVYFNVERCDFIELHIDSQKYVHYTRGKSLKI